MKKKILSFWIDEDLKTMLLKYAYEKEISQGKVINKALRKFFTKNNKKGKKNGN